MCKLVFAVILQSSFFHYELLLEVRAAKGRLFVLVALFLAIFYGIIPRQDSTEIVSSAISSHALGRKCCNRGYMFTMLHRNSWLQDNVLRPGLKAYREGWVQGPLFIIRIGYISS